MADKRKTDLPGAGFGIEKLVWNPFFEESIQALLKTRKEINPATVKQPRKGTNSFLRAWPILAYKATIGAVYWTRDAHEGNFFTYYSYDEAFIAKLFLEVTAYKSRPDNEWDLRRALTECPLSYQPKETIRRLTRGEIPETGLALYERYDFKQIAEIVSANCPHLKFVRNSQAAPRKELTADYLRTKVFFEERKRRLKILNDWKPNLDSYPQWEVRLYESDFDWSSLQYRPDPRHFQKSSVTKTQLKK